MYFIEVVGFYWAEDGESHSETCFFDGTFEQAVAKAESVTSEMEEGGFEGITYKIYLESKLVAYQL